MSLELHLKEVRQGKVYVWADSHTGFKQTDFGSYGQMLTIV